MKKKTVFITGGSSEIGIELAKLYSKKNYDIILHYNKGSNFFFNLLKKNKNWKSIHGDFSNTKSIKIFINKNKQIISKSDVFINAAATIKKIKFNEIKIEDLINIFTTNTIPGIMISKFLYKFMVKKKWGRIVHLSSIGVKYGGGIKNYTYSFSKHALEFIPTEFKKVAKYGVFYNILRIGFTDTKIHKIKNLNEIKDRIKLIPAKRIATPKEMADTIYFFGSENNTYITGELFSVSGGE